MEGILEHFEQLAQKAVGGDAEAERAFFAEAANLFPLDFPGAIVASGDENRADRISRALATIQTAIDNPEPSDV